VNAQQREREAVEAAVEDGGQILARMLDAPVSPAVANRERATEELNVLLQKPMASALPYPDRKCKFCGSSSHGSPYSNATGEWEPGK
jgi:hypothetical protein